MSERPALTYLQNWYRNFYPERPDIVAELQALAAATSGTSEGASLALEICLDEAAVRMEGRKMGSDGASGVKASCIRRYDKAMFRLERGPSRRKPELRRCVSRTKWTQLSPKEEMPRTPGKSLRHEMSTDFDKDLQSGPELSNFDGVGRGA